MVGGTINLALNWNNADNFWQGLGYFGVGAAAGVATAAIGSAGGLAVLEAATFGGAASGALIGGGNVAMQGGGFGDIAFGAMGGALIGGATGFLGGAAMMGLGEIASNIQLPKMEYANTGNSITMHPDLNDAFAHYTNIILGSGSTNLYDYFIASNGTHLRVDQYMNYKTRVDNGTAPDWMINNYSSWTRTINIPFVNSNSYPAEVELSTIAGRSLYLGDYRRYGGEYNVEEGSIGGISYQLQFDNSPMMTFGSEPVIVTPNPGNNTRLESFISRTGDRIPNSIRYVHLSSKGIVPRLIGGKQDYIGLGSLRLTVTHASHL